MFFFAWYLGFSWPKAGDARVFSGRVIRHRCIATKQESGLTKSPWQDHIQDVTWLVFGDSDDGKSEAGLTRQAAMPPRVPGGTWQDLAGWLWLTNVFCLSHAEFFFLKFELIANFWNLGDVTQKNKKVSGFSPARSLAFSWDRVSYNFLQLPSGSLFLFTSDQPWSPGRLGFQSCWSKCHLK